MLYRALCENTDKALFLHMMKDTLLGDDNIEELDSLTIYENYIKETLNRKTIEQRKEQISHQTVLKKLKRLMEDFALISIRLSPQKASLDDLKEYKDDFLATLLWENLTAPAADVHERDAENRIINRSLLKAVVDGYEFCHRSIHEYFTALAICRLIDESPGEAADFLYNFGLTFETFGFAGQILASSSNPYNVKASLTAMIEKTRGQKNRSLLSTLRSPV